MVETRVVVRDLWERVRQRRLRATSVKELLARPGVRARRGTAWALEEISFEVGPSEVVGLVGANGAGKTTLLQCIAGILAPTRGTVLVGGRTIGLLQLDQGFHLDLTGRENAVVAGHCSAYHGERSSNGSSARRASESSRACSTARSAPTPPASECG